MKFYEEVNTTKNIKIKESSSFEFDSGYGTLTVGTDSNIYYTNSIGNFRLNVNNSGGGTNSITLQSVLDNGSVATLSQDLDINLNGDEFIIRETSPSNLTGIRYESDYSTGWDENTPTGTLATKGYVDSNSGNDDSDSNAIVTNNYYQISNNSDTDSVYTDEYITLNWDETGNDLELVMDVEPLGSGDLRAFSHIPGGSVQNTAITTPGFAYDLYQAGVSSGNKLNVFVSPEDDETYPSYSIVVYNTGESYKNTVWIQRIKRK